MATKKKTTRNNNRLKYTCKKCYKDTKILYSGKCEKCYLTE